MLRITSIVAFIALLSITAFAQPKIEVIYPVPNARITAVDSTFIFGNVTPGSELRINQTSIKVHPNGAFLAYLPIKGGKFTFNLEANLDGKNASLQIPLEVPEPYVVPDTLAIVKGYMLPAANNIMMVGDMLTVAFRGTSKLNGYFRLSNQDNLTKMSESAPVPQSYWAQALFGSREIPDSLLIKGSYNGNLALAPKHVGDTLRFDYYLCRKALKVLNSKDKRFERQLDSCGCTQRTNDARLTIWPQDTVVVGELSDSVQTLRVGPRKGYFSVFQPKGIRLRVTGYASNHYRARLLTDQDVWIADTNITILEPSAKLPSGEFALVRTFRKDDGALVTFNPGALLPFDVDYDPLRKRVDLNIYNCTSNIDWVRYDRSDSLIAAIGFNQPRPGQVHLVFDLTESLWGYDAYYDGTQFNLKLDHAPPFEGKLKGIRIAVDPGHSPDPGAIGPTGYREEDANLAISLKLKERLEKEDATVFMTRSDESSLPLYDRPKLAYGFDADIFISVHNNALPDGVNPFENNGTSCFYYHPQSQELADLVYKRMVKATGLEEYGLYHGNFAVIRPTGYLAILVECAFMMIPEQEMMLQTDDFRDKIAGAITQGVLDFVEKEKMRRTKAE